MSDESTIVDQWIATTLSADAALAAIVGSRIYSELAPQGVAYPFVVFSMVSAVDVQGAAAQRIMVNGLWQVRGVAQGASYGGTLRDIADRIDVLLHRADGTASDGIVFSSTREDVFRLAEVESGQQYRHLGGTYRIYSQRGT